MENLKTKERANRIIGKEGRSSDALCKLLEPRRHVGSFDYENWQWGVLPEVQNGRIRFNYSYEDIQGLIQKYSLDTDDKKNYLYSLAMSVCGVAIEHGDRAWENVENSSEYIQYSRYPRVTGTIGDKRVSVRVVPTHWKNSCSRLSTNFTLRGNGIFLSDVKIADLSSVFVGNMLNSIAYLTVDTSGRTMLSVNPMQYCAQGCAFCYKSHWSLTQDYKCELLNLTPQQVCNYLKYEMPHINYATLNELVIMTARFNSTEHLITHMEQMHLCMSDISDGKFNPSLNSWQSIKVSTHLLKTKEDMQRAKSLGVKRFLYPLEIFDSEIRKKYMTSKSYHENKGDASFYEVLSILEDASTVFGRENIEVYAVIGLDSHHDTMKGIEKLFSLGYRTITHDIFRTYSYNQFGMYQMTLEEMIDVTMYLEEKFNHGFKQVVDFSNEYVEKLFSQLNYNLGELPIELVSQPKIWRELP